jgi:hypothetical protein
VVEPLVSEVIELLVSENCGDERDGLDNLEVERDPTTAPMTIPTTARTANPMASKYLCRDIRLGLWSDV